jgi:hypothetical protein
MFRLLHIIFKTNFTIFCTWRITVHPCAHGVREEPIILMVTWTLAGLRGEWKAWLTQSVMAKFTALKNEVSQTTAARDWHTLSSFPNLMMTVKGTDWPPPSPLPHQNFISHKTPHSISHLITHYFTQSVSHPFANSHLATPWLRYSLMLPLIYLNKSKLYTAVTRNFL